MITAFKNKDTEQHFLNKGYAVFPFLGKIHLEQIRSIYTEANESSRLNEQQFYGVNYSLSSLTTDESERIMKPVLGIIQAALDEQFENYEVLGCVFITKPPKTLTTFVYHQDWSYTNEKEHAFATCWVPLFDTNRTNGCMSVLEGTHKQFETYRSDTLDSARIDFEAIPEEIRTNIEQKAGSCLAFHQAVFHGSYPNKSDQSRPVLAFIVKSKNSDIVHYVKDGEHIRAYRLSTEAFNKMLTQIPKSSIPESAEKIILDSKIPALPTAADVIAAWRTERPNHRLLKNKNYHSLFQQQGYLLLKNVIGVEKIESLQQLYTAHFSTPKGMYVTHHSEMDIQINKSFSSNIFEHLKEFFSHNFLYQKPLIAHFAAKAPGEDGMFNLHQDWSIVREELYGVMHCWVPLQAVSKQNGTLVVLPGSHLILGNYRSGTCPMRFLPFNPFDDIIVEVEAEVGDVVLYHPALFHGSKANRSTEERLAVVAAITHPEAKRVYHSLQEDGVWLYEMTDEDLFGRLDNLAKGAAPTGEKLMPVPNRVLNRTDDEVIRTLRTQLSIKTQANVEV